MHFAKLTHAGGTEICINPQQVRAVLSQGEKGSRLVFDPAHEINVKENIVRVIEALRHAS
ncbi:MAG TPA: hypothetical protein VN829_13730 [Dongiaceae bacterium]|nr:hypothetical protein [Dongiaceae bacterium]